MHPEMMYADEETELPATSPLHAFIAQGAK
jgi:hypothetical protein